jgi:hypothetical protein
LVCMRFRSHRYVAAPYSTSALRTVAVLSTQNQKCFYSLPGLMIIDHLSLVLTLIHDMTSYFKYYVYTVV